MKNNIACNVNIIRKLRVMALAGMLSIATNSMAAEGGVEFTGSGFMTLAVGQMLGGTNANVMDNNCPCAIVDYAHAGVYDNRSGLQWQPDSKLGLQGTASFADRLFSVTAQVVSRGAQNGAGDLEWFYGSYKVNDNLTVQAGRKRLPMFYYSDTQDIGVALPWTHLPSGPYGWEVVNYNGVNIAYQNQLSNWTASANLLAGSESENNNYYQKIYYGRQSISSIQWNNILGGNLTLSNDWLETRIVYIQANTQENLTSNGWDGNPTSPTYQTYAVPAQVIYPLSFQQIYGLAVNADYNNWMLRTEFLTITHSGLGYRDYAQLIGVGYHYGKWQPMITGSEYIGREITNGGMTLPGDTPPNMQQTISLTLRYDLTTSSDLKIQYDSTTDISSPLYNNSPLNNYGFAYDYGNSQLLTFAYDVVF